MNETELWTSVLGPVFSSSLIFVLLAAMLFMSLRLLGSRRKKAYFSLTVSLLFILSQYALVIAFTASGHAQSGVFAYLSPLLQMISFVLLNMGFYQLYNPSGARHYAFYYSLIAIGIAVSLSYFGLSGGGAVAAHPSLRSIGLDLYMFVLILLCYTRVGPKIGQTGKYEFSLLLYLITQGAHVIDIHLFGGTQKVLMAIESFFPVLFYFLVFMMMFERVVELLQAIYENSITDMLTGLYNRRFFLRTGRQYMGGDQPVYALFVDIDNFKKLNDTYGHQKGDEALRAVARVLKEECADFGICGRYGGEEMVALVTEPGIHAGDLAERIRQRVEAETGVTLSIGYSKSRSGMNVETLLRHADEAMYAAKTTGKNKVVSYSKKAIQS